MKKWNPSDVIVLMLVSIIFYGSIMYFTKGFIYNNIETGDRAQQITRLLDAIIAIISVYVGAKIQKNIDK